MQVDLRRRFAQGLSFDGEFLWMKAIDNNWPSSYTGPVSYLPLETGRSAGTRKFTFVDRFLWDLPVGRQRSFFAGMNRALDVAVGGWTLAGIFTAQTGYYFNPTFSNGFAAYGLLGSRPNSVPGARWDQNVPAGSWFNPAAFEAPPQPSGGQVVLGNAGRNTIPGPGLVNLTLTISKFFTIYENHRIELKAEAYGALNHPNLSPPSANISVPSTVGRIFSASGTRSWHFAMRYEF